MQRWESQQRPEEDYRLSVRAKLEILRNTERSVRTSIMRKLLRSPTQEFKYKGLFYMKKICDPVRGVLGLRRRTGRHPDLQLNTHLNEKAILEGERFRSTISWNWSTETRKCNY